ncbi:MAG: hypothetical protein ACR2JH_07120 [Solirubrobacteraceae bacterium]
MTTIPSTAQGLASRLAALFAEDTESAKRLNDAQSRLQHANAQLWSGLHPDALALLYDNTRAAGMAADGPTRSCVVALMIDQQRAGADDQQVATAVLAAVQEIHWTVHRAFANHQSVAEERRPLAVDVGELAQQLTATLASAGWTETEARNANVNDLAEGRFDHAAH